MRLLGRVTAITGGALGIGRATGLAFAAEGALVALGDVELEAAEAVAGEIGERGGKAIAIRVDVGDAGIRVMGVLWLLAALAFLVAAIAVATEAGWAMRFTLAAVMVSLVLCVLGWPDARIGVAVNAGLVLLLAIGAGLHQAAVTP